MWFVTIVLRAYFAPLSICCGLFVSLLTVFVCSVNKNYSASQRIYSIAIALSDIGYLVFRACVLTWLGDGLRYSTDAYLYIYMDTLNLPMCKLTKSLGYVFEAYSSWLLACECGEHSFKIHFSRLRKPMASCKIVTAIVLALLVALLCLIGVPVLIGVDISTDANETAVACLVDLNSDNVFIAQVARADLVILALFDYLLPVLLLLTANVTFIWKFSKSLNFDAFRLLAMPWPGVPVVMRQTARYAVLRTEAMLVKSVANILLLLPTAFVYLTRAVTDSPSLAPVLLELKDLLATLMTVSPCVNFIVTFCYSSSFRDTLRTMVRSCMPPLTARRRRVVLIKRDEQNSTV